MGGQRADFAEFYREAKDECLLAVLVSVGDRDTAQDLEAEAFARAWASWPKVSRLPVPDLALVADRPAAGEAAGGCVDPRIMAALMRLPARQRQVVALRLFLDLDTERTAQMLGIAPGTVQAHLGRALAALRGDLITMLRQQRGRVPMTIPVEQIISRGRALRTRHRVPQAAGALGAAAAAAFAIGAVLPAGHLPPGHSPANPSVSQPSVRLAAWTVTRLADGSVHVTFREATDPAGLQRTLRADGVPASVTFTGHQNPACQAYALSGSPSTPPVSPSWARLTASSAGPGSPSTRRAPTARRTLSSSTPRSYRRGPEWRSGLRDPRERQAISNCRWVWCGPARSAPAANSRPRSWRGEITCNDPERTPTRRARTCRSQK